MHTHMVFVLKKQQETWVLKQREGRRSVFSVAWKSVRKLTPSFLLVKAIVTGVAQGSSLHLMGVQLLQNWNFAEEDFDFAIDEKPMRKI